MAKSSPKRRSVRKRAAKPKTRGAAQAKPAPAIQDGRTKLDRIVAALRAAKGATLSDLMALTGWQQHSVRGALAGALRKRGHTITSSKTDGERVYRIEAGR